MTLREQIEKTRVGDPQWDVLDRRAVLDIIDQHEQAARESIEEDLALQSISPPRSHACIPDRDALARAVEVVAIEDRDRTIAGDYKARTYEEHADAIIAALREQP